MVTILALILIFQRGNARAEIEKDHIFSKIESNRHLERQGKAGFAVGSFDIDDVCLDAKGEPTGGETPTTCYWAKDFKPGKIYLGVIWDLGIMILLITGEAALYLWVKWIFKRADN
jgi:hypothetical protein